MLATTTFCTRACIKYIPLPLKTQQGVRKVERAKAPHQLSKQQSAKTANKIGSGVIGAKSCKRLIALLSPFARPCHAELFSVLQVCVAGEPTNLHSREIRMNQIRGRSTKHSVNTYIRVLREIYLPSDIEEDKHLCW